MSNPTQNCCFVLHSGWSWCVLRRLGANFWQKAQVRKEMRKLFNFLRASNFLLLDKSLTTKRFKINKFQSSETKKSSFFSTQHNKQLWSWNDVLFDDWTGACWIGIAISVNRFSFTGEIYMRMQRRILRSQQNATRLF